MRVSAVFRNKNCKKPSAMGAKDTPRFKRINPDNTLNYYNQKDVFTRLAIASARDGRLENELKGMNLI